MIAVTFALPAESSDFIRLLQDRERSSLGEQQVVTGTLHNRALSVVHTGVGERITHDRIGKLLATTKPSLLISSGFAGATSDSMQLGDVLLAENFCAPDLLALAQRALARTSVRTGRLTTAQSVIDDSADRAELAETTGALAIDMETKSIAEQCASFGVPMLSLRAITDTPASPFPAPPHVLFDVEQQRTVATTLVLHLMTHPLAIGRLIAFAGRVKTARASLAAMLGLLLRDDAFAAAAD
jgi:nucleoside phosphorylase